MAAPDRNRSGASNSPDARPAAQRHSSSRWCLEPRRHADRLRARGADRPDGAPSRTWSSPASTPGPISAMTCCIRVRSLRRWRALPRPAGDGRVVVRLRTRLSRHGRTRRAASGRAVVPPAAAGRHHPERQRAGRAVERAARLAGHAVSVTGTRPSRRSHPRSRGRPIWWIGPPAPRATPDPVPTSRRSASTACR